MRKISDEILSSSCLITGGGSGSGFLLFHNNAQFLVTAKHVLYDHIEGKGDVLYSDEIEIACPAGEVEDLTPQRRRIDLKNAKCLHDSISDVAVVKLARFKEKTGQKKENTPIYTVTHEPYVSILEESVNRPVMLGSETAVRFNDVLLSNDTYLFGYPTSLGIRYFGTEKPLIRKGIVSAKNPKNKTIILDCPVYPGNSGGPVFQSIGVGKDEELQLIGVVSKYVPYEQKWRNVRDNITNVEYLNSGYSVASSMDTVFDLMDNL